MTKTRSQFVLAALAVILLGRTGKAYLKLNSKFIGKTVNAGDATSNISIKASPPVCYQTQIFSNNGICSAKPTISRDDFNKNRLVSIVGASFDLGQPHRGVAEAPRLLRQAGLVERLEENGFTVMDLGDIKIDDKEASSETGSGEPATVLAFNRELHNQVKAARDRGTFCLTLGGDHSVGLGTVAGHLRSDPEAVVLWVDAHADINTMQGSLSGNMHGMPVSLNIKELQAENRKLVGEEADWLRPSLLPSRIAFIGLRDVDAAEKKSIHKYNITSIPMHIIDRIGIAKAVETALVAIDPYQERNIHMSFDIDVLDPVAEAPATGTPVRGGLTLREALSLSRQVAETGRLRGLDLVEVNPRLAKSQADLQATVDAAIEVILAAVGEYNPSWS